MAICLRISVFTTLVALLENIPITRFRYKSCNIRPDIWIGISREIIQHLRYVHCNYKNIADTAFIHISIEKCVIVCITYSNKYPKIGLISMIRPILNYSKYSKLSPTWILSSTWLEGSVCQPDKHIKFFMFDPAQSRANINQNRKLKV